MFCLAAAWASLSRPNMVDQRTATPLGRGDDNLYAETGEQTDRGVIYVRGEDRLNTPRQQCDAADLLAFRGDHGAGLAGLGFHTRAWGQVQHRAATGLSGLTYLNRGASGRPSAASLSAA